MSETTFTKIISGEIPCHKVHEDELTFAFLDINPLSRGHTLVIPREAAPTLGALSDESSAAVGRVLPRLCRAVCESVGTRDYNVLQNNGASAHQAVFHVHFHIIPRHTDGSGLGIEWGARELIDGEALASSIISHLQQG
ncbi:MAG: HIT family protein [Phycisphaerales bacterium JB043]